MFTGTLQGRNYLDALFHGHNPEEIQLIRDGNTLAVLTPDGPWVLASSGPWILDYYADPSLGTVIRQRLYQPTGTETVNMHVLQAPLRKPVFFILRDGSIGISLNSASGKLTHEIVNERERTDFGGLTTTHFVINVRNYAEYS
jgi:hypothetical protein